MVVGNHDTDGDQLVVLRQLDHLVSLDVLQRVLLRPVGQRPKLLNRYLVPGAPTPGRRFARRSLWVRVAIAHIR